MSKLIQFLIALCLAHWLPGQAADRLSDMINTDKYDEVAPVIGPDGKTLYFSRLGYPEMVKTLIHNGEDLSQTLSHSEWKDRIGDIYSQLAGHRVSYPLHSVYNQDIWMAELEGENVVSVQLPGYPLNNALPNTVLSYWDQADELILLNQFFPDGSMNEGLSRITAKNPNTLPDPLHIYDFYTLGSDVQASISPDGNILILALDREDSQGDMDLYISFRSGKEIWSEPKNMGLDLNTEFRESTPFLSRSGKYLFFASNRPGGKGGMDIYVSKRKGSWETWETPIQLKAPINSISDDSHPFFQTGKDLLYFTSMREGSSDIYRYSYELHDDKAPETSKELLLKLNIVDSETEKPLEANILFNSMDDSIVKSIQSSEPYTPSITIKTPEEIKIQVEKEGYQKANYSFDPMPFMQEGEDELELLIKLKKIQVEELFAEVINPPENANKRASSQAYKIPDYKQSLLQENETMVESYIMQDILFQPQTAKIKPSSFPALKKLVNTLQANNRLKVIIEGHTDNGLENNIEKGDPAERKKELLLLSKKRARAIKSYLVEHKIDPNRVRTVGYGDQYPLNDNSNKMERSLNRRVEIILVD